MALLLRGGGSRGPGASLSTSSLLPALPLSPSTRPQPGVGDW